MKGSCDYYPYEYVKSVGMIQHRKNITKRTGVDMQGNTIISYDYDYDDLNEQDVTLASIKIEGSVTTKAHKDILTSNRAEAYAVAMAEAPNEEPLEEP